MKKFRIISRWIILAADTLVCALSLFIATQLRFNFHAAPADMELFITSLPIFMFVRIGYMLLFRTYEGIIFYTSSEDARKIFICTAIGTGTLGIINFISTRYLDKYLVPFSILGIDFFITLVVSGGGRLVIKTIVKEFQNATPNRSSVVIFGAGETGVAAKHTFEQQRAGNYRFIAFADDDTNLVNRRIDGIPIINGRNDLKHIIKDIQLLIISTGLPGERKKELVNMALEAGVRVLDVPPVNRWINGELTFSQIREVKIEDLLQREPIQLDTALIKQHLTGQHVLITGAAGSIGSEIVRQVICFNPASLVLIDQAETPLFELQSEITALKPVFPVHFYMADITCVDRMQPIFQRHTPQIIFHAAAYKHVPLMENNPTEAVRTNILGTKTCAELAIQYGASRFVMISTDKAVNPTNVMGATKRVAEIFVQSLNASPANKAGTRFITTRFGNVLGSSGSVIPIFKKQIADGGPITVTHPEVTRYFMTIPEACRLVLEAGAMGNGGEIYIFDMGAPVKIIDLANEMIRLSGFEPGKDIHVVYTGLRPGEKLYEELLNNKENTLPTHHPKIMIARVRSYGFDEIKDTIDTLVQCLKNDNAEEAVKSIKNLVPEYISQNSVYEKLDIHPVQ